VNENVSDEKKNRYTKGVVVGKKRVVRPCSPGKEKGPRRNRTM